MDFSLILERIDDMSLASLLGLGVGLLFGVVAQRSAFCTRSATQELARGQGGQRLAVWLLAFSAAIIGVQAAALLGLFDSESARVMEYPGSWSGAIVGGLVFGFGMVMARGCPGRLLILSGTGNLRALVAGLVFALTIQMMVFGWLTPLRVQIAGLWITPEGRNFDLLSALSLPGGAGLALGALIAGYALWLARRSAMRLWVAGCAIGVGLAVALGWFLTFSLAQSSFEVIYVNSVTFARPSADLLMSFLDGAPRWSFEFGLLPGVLLGAVIAALCAGEMRWQGYESAGQMRRSLAGAVLMGIGAPLAGGCAIGAGLTGGAILLVTALVATLCIWIGALIGHRLLEPAHA